ncbi:MAG: phage tail sheath subtilisin-like domain-containing protein [Bacteroidales bacterium]|jgi:phage tail sheath protein FI|nr:phage tail sheath subtilisin-like domain-containing protein [Bacteroidales bacterium]
MSAMKTPGVYLVDKNTFPDSVVEVATAVPAFIGYTEKAADGNKSLLNKPWKITSLAEFQTYFGGAPDPTFSIVELKDDSMDSPDFVSGGKKYKLQQDGGKYLLYYSMLLFYANGGGPCYIVSIGDYATAIDSGLMKAGITDLIGEQEPTMVVIPETTLLPDSDASAGVQAAMLEHCGDKMKNRFAILDIYEGYKARNDPSGDKVLDFRNKIGTGFLGFGAAYYPWLNTSIVQDKDLSYLNIANKNILQSILKDELLPEGAKMDATGKDDIRTILDRVVMADLAPVDRDMLDKELSAMSPVFNEIIRGMKDSLNLLPPGAAMAGIYTMVDNARGVWKAPANVSINSVVSPSVGISHEDQEELNVPLDGKSINAIRTFVGEGTLVWGARTLDGNSADWRYINVRRTMIMLEESIKVASKAYVFEPNVADTWVTLKSMISSFLVGIWKRGGLVGASPEEAFSVNVGLGETMTSEDILAGIMRITVLVALTRPSEFQEITFQQQMRKS